MADIKFLDFSNDLLAQGTMDADELLEFRRMTGKDFEISSNEADILFKVNNTVETPDDWPEYFINAISHYLLNQTPPQGYITTAKAAWLRARIDHDGVVESETELALLLSLLKQANNVTDDIEKFALEQVGQAVLHGKGYMGKQRELKPGVIGQTEIQILRQVLYSVSSHRGISISQVEAEFIFDLNEKTLEAENHDDWQELFVKAMTNHLMMVTAYEEPDRLEALRQENWLRDESRVVTFGSIFRGVFNKDYGTLVREERKGFSDDIKSIFTGTNPTQDKLDAEETNKYMFGNQADMAQAEKITSLEASWLIERLNRDGQLDKNEKALLAYLKQECPNIHANLTPLLNAA